MLKLSAYPRTIDLRDGTTIEVRPLAPTDEHALLSFFLGVHEDDRYFLQHDVTSPKVIASWMRDLDYRKILPLVACHDGVIVAEAVMIRGRHGAFAPLATIRVVVGPAFRERGLGSALIEELCDIATDAELEHVTMELIDGVQNDAIAAAERLGFFRAATISGLLRGRDGRRLDLVTMVLPLGKWYAWSRF